MQPLKKYLKYLYTMFFFKLLSKSFATGGEFTPGFSLWYFS